jgi:hypothetical protein
MRAWRLRGSKAERNRAKAKAKAFHCELAFDFSFPFENTNEGLSWRAFMILVHANRESNRANKGYEQSEAYHQSRADRLR